MKLNKKYWVILPIIIRTFKYQAHNLITFSGTHLSLVQFDYKKLANGFAPGRF